MNKKKYSVHCKDELLQTRLVIQLEDSPAETKGQLNLDFMRFPRFWKTYNTLVIIHPVNVLKLARAES